MPCECSVTTADAVIAELRGTLSGTTEAGVRLQVVNTVRDFCRESWAVRADALETLPAGVSTLQLANTGEGMRVIGVLSVRIVGGSVLTPLPGMRGGLTTGSGAPTAYYCPQPGQLVFNNAPDAATPLEVLVALGPADGCGYVPTYIVENHYDTLLDGAKARLMGQPGKPFSSAALALHHQRAYRRGVLQARSTANAANTRADAPWRFPAFA